MSRPTLSVAMPNYNHAAYLPRAIESILKQTRPPDELLILDDASTDNSVEIIEAFAKQHPCIRLLRNERNAGVIAAHEKLYELATGEYLYSAAADDDRYPCFFEKAMEMAAQHRQAGVIFGEMAIVDEQGEEQGVIRSSRWREPVFVSPQRFLDDYLKVEPPMHSATAATIFRRQAFAEIGWCPSELGSFADTFAVRAIALKYGACYVPERFSIWRRLAGSHSQSMVSQPRQAIDVIARAERMMQDEKFRDRFPEDYVRWWSRCQKRQIIWSHLLGPDSAWGSERPSFLIRNLRRLPRLFSTAALLFYQGDANRR